MTRIIILLLVIGLFACKNENAMKDQGGIIFYKTNDLKRLSEFYEDLVGCDLWLDQGGCRIYQFGNMLVGFCQRDGKPDTGALITFFYEDKAMVDTMYQKLKEQANDKPKDNSDYRIYHFYAKDPDGRSIEFQYFWDEMNEY